MYLLLLLLSSRVTRQCCSPHKQGYLEQVEVSVGEPSQGLFPVVIVR